MAGAAPKAIYFYTRVSPLNGYIELIEFRGRTVRLHLCIWRAVGLYLGIALGPLILPSGNWVSLSPPYFTEWKLGIALGPLFLQSGNWVSLSAPLFLWVWVHSMAGAADGGSMWCAAGRTAC